MIEDRGFVLVLYLVEVGFIAAALVGLRASWRESRAALAALFRELSNRPGSARGSRLAAVHGTPRMIDRLGLARGLRGAYGVLRGTGGPDDPCMICGGMTTAGVRLISKHLGGPVHVECIPAIVRAAGHAAVVLWLDSGDFEGGNHDERGREDGVSDRRGGRLLN